MKKIPRTRSNLIQAVRHLRKITCSTNPKTLAVYFVLTVLFTVEVVIYLMATFSWHSIECDQNTECTRILLVADPQLIGLQNEHIKLLTPISIWDSDKYLSKTFAHAFKFTKPDVIIFLGDLFDEGSTATDAEFETYLGRLFDIFLTGYPDVEHIWLPGDNDIGGEFNDKITPHKVRRFEHAFPQPDISIKNVKFLKINRLTGSVPKIPRRDDFSNIDNVVVGLSHIPLLMSPAAFVDTVLNELRPHLLFTAHTHKSMMVNTQEELRRDRLITPITPESNYVFQYLGVTDIYELLVPTCSYRMGTDKIGYGFAVIESGTLRYTVLWSPSRFLQLLFYAFLLLCGFTYLLVCRCSLCCRRDSNVQYTRVGSMA